MLLYVNYAGERSAFVSRGVLSRFLTSPSTSEKDENDTNEDFRLNLPRKLAREKYFCFPKIFFFFESLSIMKALI